MKFIPYIILIIFSFIFYSCCYTLQCGKAYLHPGFISFTPSELDTVVFRKYNMNSSFNILIDSMVIMPFNRPETFTRNDTTFLFSNGIYPFPLESNFEYELFIPATNTLIRIKDIQEEKLEQKICFALDRDQCYNKITFYNINGMVKPGEWIFVPR